MICAYLLYKRMFTTAERAIEFFEAKRLLPGYHVRSVHCYYLFALRADAKLVTKVERSYNEQKLQYTKQPSLKQFSYDRQSRCVAY